MLAALAGAGTGCSDKNPNNTEENFTDNASISSKVIYGNDSRRDWNEILDQNLLNLADSTVGIMDKADVSVSAGIANVETYDLRLCPSEKFHKQRGGPWCSGFLVGPDLIVTAGHCAENNSHCSNLSFIFGYAKKEDGHDPSEVKPSDVYNCKKLVAREFTESKADWAIIQLDRKVTDHRPLKIRRSGQVGLDAPLTLIGHPSGLPSKIARDGKVRAIENEYFKADLDSYGGNSGSAVFNAITNEVEGILVRGRTDYKFEGGCRTSNFCEDGLGGSCTARGNSLKAEHITKISEIAHLIPEIPDEEGDADDDDSDEHEEENVFSSNLITLIPDSSLKSTFSQISDVPAVENIENLKIGMQIEHTYISDLSVLLISPSNKAIYLHFKTGRRVVNINGVYGEDLVSAQDISLLGPQPAGNWRLRIIDHAPLDKGRLMKWSLKL